MAPPGSRSAGEFSASCSALASSPTCSRRPSRWPPCRMMPELGLSQSADRRARCRRSCSGTRYSSCPAESSANGWVRAGPSSSSALAAFLATIATPLVPEFFQRTRAVRRRCSACSSCSGCRKGPFFRSPPGCSKRGFPPKRWALVQGLQTAGLSLGAALTPPLIVYLMDRLGLAARPGLGKSAGRSS